MTHLPGNGHGTPEASNAYTNAVIFDIGVVYDFSNSKILTKLSVANVNKFPVLSYF